jgi:hypothetical protein
MIGSANRLTRGAANYIDGDRAPGASFFNIEPGEIPPRVLWVNVVVARPGIAPSDWSTRHEYHAAFSGEHHRGGTSSDTRSFAASDQGISVSSCDPRIRRVLRLRVN